MASTAAASIRVLYATNRIRLPVGSAEIYAANGRTGELLLGSCSISLVGGPGLSGAGLPQGVNEGDWTSDVQGKEVLVFVHGFNNTFTSAVQGAARLQVDIPFKEGPVVAFSWASWGKGEKYIEDGVIQGWSIEPFLKLLGLLKVRFQQICSCPRFVYGRAEKDHRLSPLAAVLCAGRQPDTTLGLRRGPLCGVHAGCRRDPHSGSQHGQSDRSAGSGKAGQPLSTGHPAFRPADICSCRRRQRCVHTHHDAPRSSRPR